MFIKTIENTATFMPSSPLFGCVWVVLRGELFRGTEEQQFMCIASIVDFIIKPLKTDKAEVQLVFANYSHIKKELLFSWLTSNYPDLKYLDLMVDRTPSSNQITNFMHALEVSAFSQCSVFVTRPDLLFKREIQMENCRRDNICFQWNYFHDYQTKEVPDQLHYFGADIISKVKEVFQKRPEFLGVLPDGSGMGTLHNMYNFLILEGFAKNISYLNEFLLSEESFSFSRCLLRGNPEISSLNDLYDYNRDEAPVVPYRKYISRIKSFYFIIRQIVNIRGDRKL